MRCLLLLASVFTLAWSDANCPVGYSNKDNNYCYKVFTAPKSRGSASVQCRSDGGYLSSISNAFDNSYVMTLGQGSSAMWLGIQCGGSANSCYNDDGSPLTYSNFHPGNPTNYSSCVAMSLQSPTTGYWVSSDCDNTLPFVCEVPYKPTVPVTTGSCPQNYTKFDDMCYLYVTQGMYRNDAALNCQKVPGGNLATVISSRVNGFFIQLVNQTKYGVFIGLMCPNVKKQKDSSTCYWDDGTPLHFTAFLSGNPHPGNTEACVDFNLGKWYNTTCVKWYSICQAPPNAA